jgi:hypothetical protein
MTLTQILPSLRRTLPDPHIQDQWPEFTTTSPTDVTVAGLSLVTLVQWCGTPSVHTAAAVVPGTGGRPSETELASVILTRVTGASVEGGQLNVWIDADLGLSRPIVGQTRLIGRASTAHSARAALFPASPNSAILRTCDLPLDIARGDLLAIPCRGVTLLRDVQAHGHSHRRLSDDRIEHDRDDFPFPVCGR